MSRKQIVIYHAECSDGFASAWVCRRQLENGKDAEFFPAYYSKGDARVELPDVDGAEVLMVDFSVPRWQMLEIKERAAHFQVLDHHKWAKKDCEGLDFCLFDMEQSGAGMAWRYFRGVSSPPWVVSYVEDRDLWRFALPESRSVNAYISAHPHNFDAWTEMQNSGRAAAASRGESILMYQTECVAQELRRARRREFAGYPDIPVVNVSVKTLVSDVVGTLAKDALFAVSWRETANGEYEYSLRSRSDFDVGQVAVSLGGGGHAQSAGFTSGVLL